MTCATHVDNFFVPKLQYFISIKYIYFNVYNIICNIFIKYNLGKSNNNIIYYFSVISIQRYHTDVVQKESDELSCTVWSLVMVRESSCQAQVVKRCERARARHMLQRNRQRTTSLVGSSLVQFTTSWTLIFYALGKFRASRDSLGVRWKLFARRSKVQDTVSNAGARVHEQTAIFTFDGIVDC